MVPVFLPGESPWIEGPRGLQSMGSQRVGHDSVGKHSATQLQSNLFCFLNQKCRFSHAIIHDLHLDKSFK